MKAYIRNAITGCATVLLCAACVGGPGPSERYLRLATAPAAATAEQRTAMPSAAQTIVAVKDFESLPALRRTAVLTARGSVLMPSTTLYWEGPPAELVTSAMVDALAAQTGLGPAWPYRSRLAHGAVLSGSVTAFEVVLGGEAADGEDAQDGPGQGHAVSVRVGLRADLWSTGGRERIDEAAFTTTTPASSGSAEAIARAASTALAQAAARTATWVAERLAGRAATGAQPQ
ncbi:MAG: membrane integrity-associated transporter subunit PqiC [Desulfovibrionaceae bacterium]|jgi:ABC-type uncharacterized transport system auxiliary subunit|nr:membrane integrity-associated transporter subunit PqiC [Desulfovibrionaceae bacterium]